MGYDNACTHGGPAIDLIEDCLEVLESFQNRVFSAKLFDLPPGTEHFRKEQHAADVLVLMKLVQMPEYAKLRSKEMAHVFLSEAVDSHERKEAIAHAWLCAAFMCSAASMGSLSGEEVPQVIMSLAAEADQGIASVLWRWTPCDCVKAPAAQLPWAAQKTTAALCVKSKDWRSAIDIYENVLKIMQECEESLAALLGISCFTCRGPLTLRQITIDRARILANLSLCHLSVGEAQAALDLGVEAAAVDPRFAKAFGRQVLALEALGRLARTEAEKAVELGRAAGESVDEFLEMLQRHVGEPEAPKETSGSVE